MFFMTDEALFLSCFCTTEEFKYILCISEEMSPPYLVLSLETSFFFKAAVNDISPNTQHEASKQLFITTRQLIV